MFPFSFHWYEGYAPPLTGLAVNVTELPSQTGFEPGVMVTLTGKRLLTVMVTVFDVAGLPELQIALEVRIQVTSSPFCWIKEYELSVAPVTVFPLSFHWNCGVLPPLTGVAVNITG